MKNMKMIFLVLVVVFAGTYSIIAGAPRLINYQGTLSDDAGPLDGPYDIMFRIYPDSLGSTAEWQEAHANVPVDYGLFSVILGRFTPLPDSLFEGQELWLGITVNGDPEIAPRSRMAAVPWAFRAAIADSAAVMEFPAHDHDDLYYTEWELDMPGMINMSTNPVDWTKLKSVPAGFADGVDDTGGGGSDGWVDDGTVVRLETDTDSIGIGTAAPEAVLDVRGTLNVGTAGDGHDVNIYSDDPTRRIFWSADKYAFRVGEDSDGTHWAPDSIGENSIALGRDAMAKGQASLAFGQQTSARNIQSVCLGGPYLDANKQRSIAIGSISEVNGHNAVSIGRFLSIQADNCMVIGRGVAGYDRLVNDIEGSLMIGFETNEPTLFVGGSSTNHRVGIGVTDPDEKLDVNGIIRSRSGGFRFPDGSVQIAAASGGGIGGSGSANYIARFTSSSNIGNSVIYQSAAGDIGIGTTSPSAELDVSGTTEVDYFRMPTDAGAGKILTSDASGNGTWESPSASTDGDWTVSGDDMYSAVPGEVGIGTSTPSEKLHIHGGDLRVSGTNTISAYLMPYHGGESAFRFGLGLNTYFDGTDHWRTHTDGNQNGGAAVLAGGWYSGGIGFFCIPSTGTVEQSILDTDLAYYEKMIVHPSGVGIGSPAPSPLAELHVAGDVLIDSVMHVEGTDASYFMGRLGIGVTDPSPLLQVGEGDESSLRIGRSPALSIYREISTENKYRIQLDDTGYPGNILQIGRDDQNHGISLMGDVGIGTTSPDAKLEVAGTVYSTSGGFKFPDETVQTTSAKWSPSDSVLYTNEYWGIARGGAGNAVYGTKPYTMVNLGVACTTGTVGYNYDYATIGGGNGNVATYDGATVCGGESNSATYYYSTVAGGYGNTASRFACTIGGGYNNRCTYEYGVVCGGHDNDNDGMNSSILGGYGNTIANNAQNCMIFGYEAYLETSCRIVLFEDSHDGRIGINRDDHNGGILHPIHVGTPGGGNGNGAYLTETGTWYDTSSREFKENFQAITRGELFGEISSMQIDAWNFKNSDERHIGPVSEDFVAAFDVGNVREDGTRENQYLAAKDIAGVALLGVKELIQENKDLKRTIAELTERIEKLEQAGK